MNPLWNENLNLHKHRLPLITNIMLDEENEEKNDGKKVQHQNQDRKFQISTFLHVPTILSLSSCSSSSTTYLMAILLSCLMTFLLSLFIVSLMLVWMLNNQEQQSHQFPRWNIIENDGNHNLHHNDIRSNLMIINNNRKLTDQGVGFGHIISMDLSRQSSLSTLEKHINDIKPIPRNSSIYLQSAKNLSLSEILKRKYPENFLLNFNQFKFLCKHPEKLCQNLPKVTMNENYNSYLNLVIVIHSAVEHFHRRQIIRKTWTEINRLLFDQQKQQANIIYAFMLGDQPAYRNRIQKESAKYNDIVQGNFLDTYRNLTLKHTMTLRWSVEYCPNAQFIMKIDDDAYLDIYAVIISLFNLKKTDSHQNDIVTKTTTRNLLACSLFPNNTRPKRQGKWSLSMDIYPYDYFPSYCSGIGYLMTPDVAFDLFEAIQRPESDIPLIPIDDVYVTGLVVNRLKNLERIPLNSLYVYNVKKLREWLTIDDDIICPNYYWIGDIGSESDWPTLSLQLWNKTKRAWKNVLVNNIEHCKLNNKIIMSL